MADTKFDLSIEGESQYLAIEYMKQKSITDDAPEDIAREYRMVQQKIKATLETL